MIPTNYMQYVTQPSPENKHRKDWKNHSSVGKITERLSHDPSKFNYSF